MQIMEIVRTTNLARKWTTMLDVSIIKPLGEFEPFWSHCWIFNSDYHFFFSLPERAHYANQKLSVLGRATQDRV
jgi:hypothetical protein